MSARSEILGKIRKSLNVLADNPERMDQAQAHIAALRRHPIPERVAGKDRTALKSVFRQQLQNASTTLIETDGEESVPAAISDFLRQNNLPQTVRAGNDPDLAALPWQNAPALTVNTGAADPDDSTGLSRAVAGVAETGTLVLVSGPDNPVTLNFLPETHIIVLREHEIVGAYEDGFDLVRKRFGLGKMPRTVNLISGPSRTGDIGGRIVMGAHGPRRLCVIVVRQASD